MQDEVQKAKARYAKAIEDGRKIEVFTSMPEYQWYVDSVVKPTIEEYTNRILSGEITTDKEDWILRGMIMGMKLMIDTPENFVATSDTAKKKAKELNKFLRDEQRREDWNF